MGLNRFSTTGTSEYTPQYVPLPFDTISKLGEQVKLEHDTADASAAVAKTDIQGGLATQEHAKALNIKKNAMLKEAQDRAEKTGNYGRLTQDIKEIASTVQNDPLYQGIQRDVAITKEVNKRRADPSLKYTVQGFADEKGNVKQLGLDQQFDESYYNVVAPVDFYGDHKDVYDKIKEQSVKQGGPSTNLIYRTTYDSAGNELIQGFSQQGQKIREGIAPEDLAAFADRWVQDPSNMRTRGSVGYKDAYLKQTQGIEYTPEMYKQDLINNFPGYHEKTSDVVTEKALGVKSASKGGKGDGSGSGGDALPNQYALLVDAKSTQVATPQLKGLGLAEGPKDVPGSYMVTLDNTDGQGAIVNFAKVTQDNPQANKIISYGGELNNLEKKLGVFDNESLLEKLQLQNPNVNYKIIGNNVYTTLIPGKSTKEDLKLAGTKDIKTVKDNFIKSSDDYKLLAEEAKEQGLNLNDPKFKENYLKTLGVKNIEEANAMGQMFDFKGDYPFILKDGNNKTNVGDKAYLDGYIILTKDQINEELVKNGKYGNEEDWTGSPFVDEWQELFLESSGGNGMIQPYTRTRDGIEQFKIPIKKPIQISQIVNQNYNSSFYGDAVTGKNAQHFADTYNEMIGKNMIERRNKIYNQSYTENPTMFINNLTTTISSNKELAAENKERLSKILEEVKNNKSLPLKDKKEIFINFKNGLEDPEKLIADYDAYMNSSSVGKSQGGWSQTPATPRK